MQHSHAQINNINLHYVSEGEGELVLLLHGFPEYWYTWRGQIDELSKDYHAIAPDMRGYNLSDKPDGVSEYTIEKLIDDIRALIEHLGYKRCHLVGHDWGGIVAWAFALRYPEYLDRLIIINSPHPAIFARELGNNRSQQAASRYVRTFRSPQAEEILSTDNYAKLKQSYMNADDEKEYISAWSQPGALTAMLNYYRANDPLDTSIYNNLIVNVPTMVIWGENDTALLTGNLEGLGEYVPDLTVRRIPGASHWVVHEQPDMVSGYIREFIYKDTIPFINDFRFELKDEVIKYIKILASKGWTLPMTHEILDTFKILHDNQDNKTIDNYFVNYYKRNNYQKFDLMVENINNNLDIKWKNLFLECISAYKQNLVLITIPALLSIIEGNILRIHKTEGLKVIKPVKDILNNIDDKYILKMGWDSTQIVIEKLFQKSDFSGQKPNILNRHWVLHGRDETNWKEEDTLRLFQLLETILLCEQVVNKNSL